MTKERDMISTSDPRVCLIGHPAPAWMVNYADLMTELVCFFIVLYALSASLNKSTAEGKAEAEKAMQEQQIAGEVKVDKQGMTITIQETGDNVFFTSGSAELSTHMEEILGVLGPTLKKMAADSDIIVEGHTDNVPIRTVRYPSNWELSTARATSVVQQLIKAQGLPPAAMGAIGYGQFKPLVANDSEENRGKNRRVVFFVKNRPAKPSAGDKPKAPPAAAKSEEGTAVLSIDSAGDATEQPDEDSQAEKELPIPAQPDSE